MRMTSEYVSPGHPDKVADGVASYILDRFLEKDPAARYALEVMIKDNYVTLGGEITSTAKYSDGEIAQFVRDAVNDIGYTREYQKRWGKENTICGDELVVMQRIGRQSPDISQGVDDGSWGDQGIFWGMAVNSPATDYMPEDWHLARKIGRHLYDIRYAGLDIKTQVTMNNGKPEEIVVAIPMLEKHSNTDIANAVEWCCGGSRDYDLHINGTGRFVTHGPVGDCGVTGRKLAVDLYGGSCRIGGGSTWGKDATKADVTLNIYARHKALQYIKAKPEAGKVCCSIACRIGSPEILVCIYDEHMNEITSYREIAKTPELIGFFKLNTPRFAKMCVEGLFA